MLKFQTDLTISMIFNTISRKDKISYRIFNPLPKPFTVLSVLINNFYCELYYELYFMS